MKISTPIFYFAVTVAIILAGMLAVDAGAAFRPGQFAPDPTPAMIAACTQDALRFCADMIPPPGASHDAIRACMVRHRAQLSQECRAAFK